MLDDDATEAADLIDHRSVGGDSLTPVERTSDREDSLRAATQFDLVPHLHFAYPENLCPVCGRDDPDTTIRLSSVGGAYSSRLNSS